MDRMLNSNKDTESIYEIYRACRLCGGGAGYKMPIIQNIVDLDESDVELKQKIRDCVQIEVHQDDKMPPLICELCVDKVNDFYEFLDMCRQTNKRTRLRLGLPPQSLPRGAPDAGDCILGVTEPIFVNEDSDGEPLSKHKKTSKVKVKKEPVVRLKIEDLEEQERRIRHKSSREQERNSRHRNSDEQERRTRHRNSDEQERSSRHRNREPSPRVTRHSKSKDDDVVLSSLKDKTNTSKSTPKSILKKDSNMKSDESTPITVRLKRLRDKEQSKSESPAKKVKITTKTPTPPQSSRQRLSPKSSPRLLSKSRPTRTLRSPVSSAPKRPPSPVREPYLCNICGYSSKTSQARANHLRAHTVGYTNNRLACNPCCEWFPTTEELSAHQKKHKSRSIPYNCRRCDTDFRSMTDYEEHLDEECIPLAEVPDVKCDVCWHSFATNNLLVSHRCLGEDNRPGGKCFKCSRSYALLKNLKKHETTCTAKKKGDLIINKELLSKLKPIQVRIARCDPLLTNVKQEHYDVSSVSDEYGLDESCYYPYISGLRIKSEFPGMVDIQDEIKKEFCSEDYIHWDSEESDSDDEISCNMALNSCEKKKRVPSLAAVALKTIFSHRLLGKVPRKKRKVKQEKVFDSMLTDQDDVRMDISSLINNLGDDDINIGDNTRIESSINDCDDKDNDSVDLIKDSVINNCVNDNDMKDKTDTVSSIDDSVNLEDVKVDLNKNNDINSNKDNSSIDSMDILQDVHNNDNENKNNGVADSDINDKHSNDLVEKDSSKTLSRLDINSESMNHNSKFDEKDLNLTINNDNYNLESKIANNLQNNDSECITNDNDLINNDMLADEFDKKINESDISNSINENSNSNNDTTNWNNDNSNLTNDNSNSTTDKVISALDDLLTNNTDSRVSLSNIDDFNFES